MSTPNPIIQNLEKNFTRDEPLPEFRPGDTVRVWVRIREGEKTRRQAFEGVCIRKKEGGNRATFTVRKISYGVGVERVFAINSPNVESVEIKARGKVRQSRLYYLRGLSGKAARIKERAYDSAVEKTKKGKKRGKRRKAAAAEARKVGKSTSVAPASAE